MTFTMLNQPELTREEAVAQLNIVIEALNGMADRREGSKQITTVGRTGRMFRAIATDLEAIYKALE